MEKKIEKIKPPFSENLEALIKEQDISKRELARLLCTTPQTISKACNGIRLTKTLAEDIVELFPEYNIGWLLGYSNLKYKEDVAQEYLKELLVHQEARMKEETPLDTIARLACDAGFDVFFDGRTMEINPNKELEEQGYNPVTLTFKNNALSNLQDDVYAFIKYRFEVIIKRGR